MKVVLQKNIILISIIILLLFNNAIGQIEFKISEINVSNIEVSLNPDIIDEDLRKGPYVLINCVIENNTDSILVLYPSGSETNICFSYKDDVYFNELFSLSFLEKDSLELIPKQKITIIWGIYILLGTPILESAQEDYTIEMLEILPTLKVIYRDKNLKIEATEIFKVNVIK
jgi:hypothetical protein